MTKFFLTILCIFSVQSAFSKEIKINEKTGVLVVIETQSAPQLMNVCANCSREIRQACYNYTSTRSNEDLCNEIGSDPQVTRGCYYSSTASGEAECLRQQVNPEIARGCKLYTSTDSSEKLCMALRVSPYDAQTCKQYTSTVTEEVKCLRECGNKSRRDNSL